MWRVCAVLALLHCTSAYLGPKMGMQNQCDDGKSNLYVDWNPSDFTTFTCMADPFPVKQDVGSILFELKTLNSSFNPKTDVVYHKCMSEKIEYDTAPPLRGDHRPNWARYGEYLYVPEQRWLHNLEHGSIILLYHPCADQDELDKLRKIVTACLYRHVITPYNKLSAERPFALVSWGSKLEMNHVDEREVVNFIKDHARIAPEDLSKDGIYDAFLMQPARIVSDEMDNNLSKSMELLQYTIDDAIVEIDPSLISKLAKCRNEGLTVTRSAAPGDEGDAGSESMDGQGTSASKKQAATGPKMPSRCWLCKANRLRVVTVGSTGRRILECANRNCLATIEYTDLPEGTIIEQEKATKRNYGWYLRDTSEMVYPSKERLEAFPNPPFEYVPEVLYDSGGRVVVRCPGQRKLVLLQ